MAAINELPAGSGQHVSPDMVIGVDFGMTQTGVSYCSAPWTNPKSFQHWSGNVNEIANKVPTRVAYDIHTGKLRSWGFGCDLRDPNLDVVEHFKLYLDPDYKDDYADITCADAQRFFYDFLFLIHEHVAHFFRMRIPNWTKMRIEWIFSVPTTWRDAAFIHGLEGLIKSAGFGNDGALHSCRITLTEAEAAGISVASQYLEGGLLEYLDVEKDDVILVCDAGGGTTDVNILKLVSDRGQPLRLDPLSRTEGKPIGSALIDIRIQQLLERYLQNIAAQLTKPPSEVAEQMMIGRFERFKCNFGAPGSNIPYLLLDVPDLPPGQYIPQANIVNSQIRITSEILKNVFDEQVDALVGFVHNQIKELHYHQPGERVHYIILSGGLGSSPYVQDRLRWHFDQQTSLNTPASIGLKILAAEEPQLAVVHGLVLERAQQVAFMTNPITARHARVSYGIVVNQRYDPKTHQGVTATKDPRDGKKWVVDRVEWLIRQGETVRPDGFIKRLRAKLDPLQIRQPWHAHFVMTTAPPPDLPGSLSDPRVQTVCIVRADVSQTKRIVKNGHWYNVSQRYELTLLDVRIIPGSADLKVEVWNDGRKLNNESDQMEFRWEDRLGTPAWHQHTPPLDRTLSPSSSPPQQSPNMNGSYNNRLSSVPSQQLQRTSYVG